MTCLAPRLTVIDAEESGPRTSAWRGRVARRRAWPCRRPLSSSRSVRGGLTMSLQNGVGNTHTPLLQVQGGTCALRSDTTEADCSRVTSVDQTHGTSFKSQSEH